MLYSTYLTTKSICKDWYTLYLLLGFLGIRILSFLLAGHTIIQGILVFAIIMLFSVLYFKKPHYAFGLLLGELFLGGAGHFLELGGLSLRLLLLGTFGFLWIIHALTEKHLRKRLYIPHKIFYLLIPLLLSVFLAIIIGLSQQNNITSIIQDLIPFAFLLIILPAYHIMREEHHHHLFIRLFIVFIVGSFLFALANELLFSLGAAHIHGEYYNWFRDVAAGKITYMSLGFFRIVTPEHLFIPIFTLIIASLLMREEKHHAYWYILLFCTITILVLNFSRAYILGTLVGLCILKYSHSWKRWAEVCVMSIGIFFISFIAINIFVSSGLSFGSDMLKQRAKSFTSPETEISTSIRTALISPIIEKIKQQPFFGSGLGSAVRFYDPNKQAFVTTTQLDWGYLELIVEIGILGLIFYLTLIGFILYELHYHITRIHDHQHFYVGVLASVFAILAIHMFTPALFHVLGIVYLALVIAFITQSRDIIHHITGLLYRIFHRIHHR